MFCCDIGKGKKRARTTLATNIHGKGRSAIYVDESFGMIDRDAQEDSRLCLDLSIFEMPASKPLGSNEKSEEESQFDSGEEYASEPDYSCVVLVDGPYFQELPVSWRNLFKRPKRGRWIMYLQGLDNRIWPVFYCTRSRFNDVLTSGWKQVTTAYGLNAGEFCLFELVNKPEHLFSVRKL